MVSSWYRREAVDCFGVAPRSPDRSVKQKALILYEDETPDETLEIWAVRAAVSRAESVVRSADKPH
jgi:hypothetical protein